MTLPPVARTGEPVTSHEAAAKVTNGDRETKMGLARGWVERKPE